MNNEQIEKAAHDMLGLQNKTNTAATAGPLTIGVAKHPWYRWIMMDGKPIYQLNTEELERVRKQLRLQN